MASSSFQNEIPKARINIKLDLHTGGAQKKVELPLKLLVMGDYSNGQEQRPRPTLPARTQQVADQPDVPSPLTRVSGNFFASRSTPNAPAVMPQATSRPAPNTACEPNAARNLCTHTKVRSPPR